MSKEEQQALKTCFNELHLRFSWCEPTVKPKKITSLPRSFHVSTRQIWQTCSRRDSVNLVPRDFFLAWEWGWNDALITTSIVLPSRWLYFLILVSFNPFPNNPAMLITSKPDMSPRSNQNKHLVSGLRVSLWNFLVIKKDAISQGYMSLLTY